MYVCVACAPMASVTCTVTAYVCGTLKSEVYVAGTPDISPLGLMLRPGGNEPAGALHVYGGRPPGRGDDGLTLPTAIWTLYGVPTCTGGVSPRVVPSGTRAKGLPGTCAPGPLKTE